jgi:hypothetical protein
MTMAWDEFGRSPLLVWQDVAFAPQSSANTALSWLTFQTGFAKGSSMKRQANQSILMAERDSTELRCQTVPQKKMANKRRNK